MKKTTLFTLIFVFFAINNMHSQPGSLDTSFDPGTGANLNINTVAIQTDGKIIIGGDFTSYNGVSRNRIARINTDGSLDTSFDIGVGFDPGSSGVQSLVIDANGKIIVVGGFNKYNTIARKHIVRLNTDGSIDNTFSIGVGASSPILSVATQPDGKIIIGGGFTSFKGNDANRILRLNASGSIDSSFDIGTGFNNSVNTIAVQEDGKIIIGGGFLTYDDVTVNKLVRLNSDGSIDSDFIINTFTDNAIWCAKVQDDGKIVISGLFKKYNNVSKNYLTRLNADGSIDNSFDIGLGANSLVRTLALQSDNDKIIFGGTYQTYNSLSAIRISRLMPSGLKDTNFDTGTGANKAVNSIMIQPDGHLIMVGDFTSYNGVTRNRIARVLGDPTPLSTPNFKNNIVSIYPNPSNGTLYFSASSDIDIVKIHDTTGKLVLTGVDLKDNKIDVSNLSNGIYFLSLQNNENGVVTQKFIKN